MAELRKPAVLLVQADWQSVRQRRLPQEPYYPKVRNYASKMAKLLAASHFMEMSYVNFLGLRRSRGWLVVR